MRRSIAILPLFLGVMSAACGQPVGPISPTATEGSLRRIVEDVSGGNVGTCTPVTCVAILQGAVALTSSAGALSKAYPDGTAGAFQDASQSREFDVTATVMTATERLAERGVALFMLQVTPQSASVWVNLNGPNGTYFLATGTATPEFSVTTDASCTSGQRLHTTMALHLSFLGQTEIVDNHCIR